ncbi:MAG: cysteine desulfurase [Spirochaetaceae bacterium]|nr:cysteine desulfurase [Spirochaetaceae bacterium]
MTSDIDFHGYFDWAATTPPDTAILQDSLLRTAECFANPSSVHKEGLKAKELLSEARTRCAKALGVAADTLIFTSGGTESDHWPVLSLLQRPRSKAQETQGNIIISAIEHPAIRGMCESMKNLGYDVISVKPEKNGIVDAEKLLEKVNEDTLLVCLMAVNNETGAIQPVYQVADGLIKLCAGKRKPKFHVDAVQAAGKIPLSLAHPGIDSAAISAHKLRGPRGIGLLYLAKRQETFLRGGEQENGLRAGTENVAGALSLAACLEKYALTPEKLAAKGIVNQTAYKRYTEQLETTAQFVKEISGLKGCRIIPEVRTGITIEDSADLFSPWIVQASFDGIPGEVMVRALSEKGFSISTGSACSAKKLSRPILEAMGIKKDQASTAVSFSFGAETTKEDTNALIQALTEIRALFK